MEKQNRTKYALASFFAVFLFVITYKYVLWQLAPGGLSDLAFHTKHAESIYLDRFTVAWLKVPYLFWHLCVKGFIKFLKFPLNDAAACTCATFAFIQYFITLFIIEKIGRHYTGRDIGFVSPCIAGMLGLVMPLYIWWFNGYQHEGQFSINPIYNPTHMAVKPFGLLAFAIGVDLILLYQEKEPLFFTGKKLRKWLYVLFAVVLFLSTFMKPTFMYMLLPAGAIYLLIDFVVALLRKDGSYKKVWNFMWKIACASVPAILYLLIEYGVFYFWEGTNRDSVVAIYPFLTAWHLFSPDVPTSIMLAMAFPLWMLITNCKYFLETVEGRLSVIGYAVGTLEFSFFVETGDRLEHLNFAWELMSGMLLFWVIAGARLAELTFASKPGKKNTIIVIVGWILLSIHLFSGFFYLNPSSFIL